MALTKVVISVAGNTTTASSLEMRDFLTAFDLDRANIRLAFKSLPISLEKRNQKLLCIINGRIEVEGNGDFLADLCGAGENLGNAVCRPNADWLHEQVDSAPIVCRHAELPVS